MFDYLQKFNNLPKDLRDRVSSPSVMAIIADLESKYRVDLAMSVMKVMIKSLPVKNLPAYFISELGLLPAAAESLAREMKEKVFASVAEYLGLSSEMRAFDLEKDIDVLIKEAGLVLPSAVLISRFKNIISTYLRGVRNKIDTKNSLSKDVKIGGLSLSATEVDRVLKVCDTSKFANLSAGLDKPLPAAPAVNRLDKIIASSDNVVLNKDGRIEEYSLKNALASGQVKIPALTPSSTSAPAPVRTPVSAMPRTILDTKHEIAAPAVQLDLPVGHMPVPVPPKPPVAVSSLTAVKPIISSVPPVKPPVTAGLAPQAAAKSITKPVNLLQRLTSKLAPLKPMTGKPVSQQPSVSVPAASKTAPLNTKVSAAPSSPAPVRPAAVKAAAPSLANRPATASPSRPQMHDIKPVPKVMGPIEELQFLDVVNFRRLGKTPGESITKIFMKIKLLEKDGYDKMIAGIQAWRQSPVNRLYLRLGQEAVAKGIPFKEAIALRQKADQECLSMEEIESIVSLNSRLVF